MGVRIGIPVPTSDDLEYNRKDGPAYAAAVSKFGAEPVSISLVGNCADLRRFLESCEGFVLPGSPADVDPALYGQARMATTAAADPARELRDRAVLEHAAESGKPVLAICFGAQFLNVWCGGSLVQDLAPVPVNHSAGAAVGVAHSAWIAGQSLLAGLLDVVEAPQSGEFRRLSINSSHHQAIAEPGEHLVVVARSVEDGVIEAVEGRVGSASVVGVQWHPERSVGSSAGSRALFTWLVSEADDWKLRREDAGAGTV